MRYPGLDQLRAASVLAVLVHHYFDPLRAYGNVGSLGVQLFFVISGFLITSRLLEEEARARVRLAEFYLRRALQDDISRSNRAPKPLVALDFGLVTIRTAEVIAVGLAFGKAMGCDPERTILSFASRWKRLKGRQLTSWVNPERYISPTRSAYQDEVVSFVDVPLELPLSALSEYVHKAIQPVFEVFDGFSLSKEVTEDLTRRLVERRL